MAEDKRTLLLQSTVRAVAKCGMKDVSTRSISGDAGINDAYIYRYFRDKEDMLMQAYFLENERFMRCVGKQIDAIREERERFTLEERCHLGFRCAWRYLIDNPDVCRFFVYYYHSPNFQKYAFEEHRKQVDYLAEKILHLFERLPDAEDCLYALFTLLHSFALRVLNGELPDDAETEERVFKMVFTTILTQMKATETPEDSENDQKGNGAPVPGSEN